MIAATSSAKTMANPAPLPTCRISSTGSSEMMPKATAPVETRTPMKFQSARPDDGDVRLERVGVDDGGDGVGRVVEAVDELEPQRDEERDAEQDVRQHRPRGRAFQVPDELRCHVGKAASQRDSEADDAQVPCGF